MVWDLNAERRNLSAGQKAALYLVKETRKAEWAEAKYERQEKANHARSEAKREAAREQPRAEDGTFEPSRLSRDKPLGQAQCKQRDKVGQANWSYKQTAQYAKVSDATAARAEALANARPDLLNKVASGEMSLGEAQRQMKRDVLQEKAPQPLSGKYRVVYADPPWKYSNSGDGIDQYGPAERHYPAMTISELCAMPIQEHVEDDAVLFLWVTSPMLEDAFRVIGARGFQYKSSFVWDKIKHNFGHYNSVRHEFLLICTRGSCTPDCDEKIDSVQSIERSDHHSEKPDEFRAIIDKLYRQGRRLELFARQNTPGWDAWGLEAPEPA
jgi:N6-adenosine-specific RNA methylase IME4